MPRAGLELELRQEVPRCNQSEALPLRQTGFRVRIRLRVSIEVRVRVSIKVRVRVSKL